MLDQQATRKLEHKDMPHSHMLRPVKDDLGLKVPGIYSIPCKHGKMYIGQTGQFTETRCKEHNRHLCSHQSEKYQNITINQANGSNSRRPK